MGYGFYDQKTNSYIGGKNPISENLKEKSIGGSQIPEVRTKKNYNNKKKKEILRRILLIAAASTTLTVGGKKAKQHYDNNKIYEKIKEGYSSIVTDNTYRVSEDQYAYNNDKIAEEITKIQGIDDDDIMFLTYDNYGYKPSYQMDEVLNNIDRINATGAKNERTQYLQQFDSFEDYYNKLGYKNENDYKDGMTERVVVDAKKVAVENAQRGNYDGPIIYDFSTNTFTISADYSNSRGK
jgi:hypothetical protein